jgi:hypothetical protein
MFHLNLPPFPFGVTNGFGLFLVTKTLEMTWLGPVAAGERKQRLLVVA